jgi:hypothetical protein
VKEGPGVGPHPRGFRVVAPRLGEHAGAEVNARDPSLAQGPENQHARAGTAAHVQPMVERPEFKRRVGDRAENAPRRERIVAFLAGPITA